MVEERRVTDLAESASPVDRAKAALARHAWLEAYELLAEADAGEPLAPADLELYAQAAWWTGRLPLAMELRERAYGAASRAGDTAGAVTAAVGLARDNVLRNDMVVARAWISRAERLLEGAPENVGHAYLAAVRSFAEALAGSPERALEEATRAIDIATRLGERDIAMVARSEKGFALIALGKVEEGLALVDEATVAAVGGELEASAAGGVCCTSIEACAALGDWARAASWTEAQDRWCRREGINGYPGMCRLFRSEIKQFRGAWLEAEAEARQASVELDGFMPAAAGKGFYRIGELRLLRGDLPAAEEALTRAHALGMDPEPALSLLRLAQGRPDLAAASIRRALDDPTPLPNWRATPGTPLHRMPMLRAQAEIALAAGDVPTARTAADELTRIAADYGAGFARATAAGVDGAVLLAEGKNAAAATALRRAVAGWLELQAPYEVARARLLLADALVATDAPDDAILELHAARLTFEQLAAVPDLRRTEERLSRLQAPDPTVAAETQDERVARTFMFTDIVDSTKLAEALGDASWGRLLRWHDALIRSVLAEHGGEEIKATGDGFFLAFADPGAALDAAIAVQRRLTEEGERHGFAPSVRIGLHAAEASRSRMDYIGIGVNYAARIGAAAASGEILVSERTMTSLNRSVRERTRRTLSLKGISDPVEVVSVDWT